MNDTDAIKTIAAEIEAEERRQKDIVGLVVERSWERREIEASIAAAQNGHDGAAAALGGVMARAELGEADADAIAAARAAMTQAADALAKAREREGEASDLALTVAGLERRQVEISDRLTTLRAQYREKCVRVLVRDLHQRIADYLESATATVERLVAVLALDDYLKEVGADQKVRPSDWGNAFLPGFMNHPLKDRPPPSFVDLMRDARDSLIRERGQPMPGGGLVPLQTDHAAAVAPAQRRMSKPPASFTPGSVK